MTQEEKSLLLQDLCARLPYGVQINHQGYIQELTVIVLEDIIYSGHEVRPYLRTMSSMTKDERYTYLQRIHDVGRSAEVIDEDDVLAHFDWLNEHHFDYRGLIPKGLALEAPEDMYK